MIAIILLQFCNLQPGWFSCVAFCYVWIALLVMIFSPFSSFLKLVFWIIVSSLHWIFCVKLQRGWCFSLQASCPFGFENKESPKAIPNVATREPLPITPYAPAPSSLPSARNLGPGFFHHIPACHHDNEWITQQYLLACPIYGPAFCRPPQWHGIRTYTPCHWRSDMIEEDMLLMQGRMNTCHWKSRTRWQWGWSQCIQGTGLR